MEENTTEQTEAEQPRLVYYEPDHDGDTLDIVAAALSLRGYKLTSTDEGGVDAMAIVEPGARFGLYLGDLYTRLPAVEEFPSPAAYAGAIADWLDGKTDGVEIPAETEERDGLRQQIAGVLYDGAKILAYNVGHDIGEMSDVVAGLAGRGIMLVPAVGNVEKFATAAAADSLGNTESTRQYGTVVVTFRSTSRVIMIDRGELTTEGYVEALASAVEDGAS